MNFSLGVKLMCDEQGTVAAVPCKDAVRDYGNSAAAGPTDKGARQLIHAKHRDWVTQVGVHAWAQSTWPTCLHRP